MVEKVEVFAGVRSGWGIRSVLPGTTLCDGPTPSSAEVVRAHRYEE